MGYLISGDAGHKGIRPGMDNRRTQQFVIMPATLLFLKICMGFCFSQSGGALSLMNEGVQIIQVSYESTGMDVCKFLLLLQLTVFHWTCPDHPSYVLVLAGAYDLPGLTMTTDTNGKSLNCICICICMAKLLTFQFSRGSLVLMPQLRSLLLPILPIAYILYREHGSSSGI